MGIMPELGCYKQIVRLPVGKLSPRGEAFFRLATETIIKNVLNENGVQTPPQELWDQAWHQACLEVPNEKVFPGGSLESLNPV